MMIQEFIERTNYTPSPDEYYHIEKAYYDFDGNKDDFCKWWKKAKRGGYWDRELELRRHVVDTAKKLGDKIKECSDSADFYRPYFARANNAELLLELVFSEKPLNLSIWYKDGKRVHYDNVTVKYIPKSYNGKFAFINLKTAGGYITSVKLSDVENIFRRF